MRRRIVSGVCFAAGLLAATSLAGARPQEGGKDDTGGVKKDVKKDAGKDGPKDRMAEALVARLMALDADKDGKLSKDEVTDERLKRLFDQADTDKDGFLTREELTALIAKEGPAALFGPPGGFPKGGPGMMPPGFGPPQPGQVMPPFLRDFLKLSDEQKKQLDDLQKEVDGKLEKILNADQKKQLDDMKKRGPAGFGPPPGGFPGGPPGGFPGGGGAPPPPKDKAAPPPDKP